MSEFAGELASMRLQQVHAAEAGRAKPGCEVLLRLAAALQCDLALIPWENT